MKPIDKSITKFIQQHHVLTLATSSENTSWCCSCFYVYLEEQNIFVLLSDTGTKHVEYMQKQKRVAGAIALETKIIGKIQGIQFTGDIEELKGEESKIAKHAYLKAFPYAIFKKTLVWGLKINYLKMTDNRLGFGKKLIWEDNF
jgi:hypothetical protein